MAAMSDELENLEPEGVSKSQLKREMLELQQVGERLVNMSAAELAAFPLTPALQEALEESQRIKGHGAMRRHVRRVGKLLRHADSDAIRQLLERLDNRNLEEKQRFHQLERWRDRLLQEGDRAFVELLELYPDADRQQLRQFIRAAHKELKESAPPAAARKLFRYLRELSENVRES
jgi:ribosome-associated protein